MMLHNYKKKMQHFGMVLLVAVSFHETGAFPCLSGTSFVNKNFRVSRRLTLSAITDKPSLESTGRTPFFAEEGIPPLVGDNGVRSPTPNHDFSQPTVVEVPSSPDSRLLAGETTKPLHNQSDLDVFKFRTTSLDLSQAGLVGIITGLSVVGFKLLVELVRSLSYEQPLLLPYPELRALIPALGGLGVGALMLTGKFPSGLRGLVKKVDKSVVPSTLQERSIGTVNSMRKSSAAVVTLGTGCSLGPEGPCVEIGMNVARSCMDIHEQYGEISRKEWNRILLSCGAAAGVAAGFDAPVAGVFFALEVMQNAFSSEDGNDPTKARAGLFAKSSTLTPVLLSSILSALISRTLLGEHLILKLTSFSLQSPLIEIPMFFLLGLISGIVAFSFSQLSKLSSSFFTGELGPVSVRDTMSSIPAHFKPALGGLFCGVVGLMYPQILFFGYETLNGLLTRANLPVELLIALLFAKMTATAVSAGSGLVGGTFAPSLFLGAVTGACFYDALVFLCQSAMNTGSDVFLWGPSFQLADIQSWAMVGAASTLAALFRAPLTATLLAFELTRDYNVILPIMASAGLAALFADMLDYTFERDRERRAKDAASWGALADTNAEIAALNQTAS